MWIYAKRNKYSLKLLFTVTFIFFSVYFQCNRIISKRNGSQFQTHTMKRFIHNKNQIKHLNDVYKVFIYILLKCLTYVLVIFTKRYNEKNIFK